MLADTAANAGGRRRTTTESVMAVSLISSKIVRPGGRIVIVRPTRRR
jgi:hypothetical protein